MVRLTTVLPAARSRAAAIVLGSELLICGGLTSAGGTTDTILGLNLATGRATTGGTLPLAVHDAAGAELGDAGFVFGGGRATAGRSVQQVNAAGLATSIGELPNPRADLAAVTVAGEILVVGGGTPGAPDPHILATHDGVHFEVLGRLPVAVRYPAVAVLEGVVYVAGGSTAWGETDAIQAIDPATGAVRLVGHLPHPITDATAFSVGGQVLIAGGRYGGRVQSELWAVNPDGRSARSVGRLPNPVADAAGVVVDGVGYVIGGESSTPTASILAISAP